MKKSILFFMLATASTAQASQSFDVDWLEAGALGSKMGMTSTYDKETQRAILYGITALRFYQGMMCQTMPNIDFILLENAVVALYKDLFSEDELLFRPYRSQNTAWGTFWKLCKADFFGMFLAAFLRGRTYQRV